MTEYRPTARLRLATPAYFVLACLAWSLAAAESLPRRQFNLPAGSAEQSLKRFSTQAGIEVVFATHVADGVRTAALRGEFPPLEALERILDGTPLFARWDERAGAIVVSRRRPPDPNGQRAAPTAGDRPKSPLLTPKPLQP